MDLFIGMESPYSDELLGGYYEEYYSPDQGGSYYDPYCSNFSYDAQDLYVDDNSKICAGMEEQTSSKWDEILDVCIIEIQENRKVANQRLLNLERNTVGARSGDPSRISGGVRIQHGRVGHDNREQAHARNVVEFTRDQS